MEVSYSFDGEYLSFDVKNWNRKEKLVIDPPLALSWSTYYGGSYEDEAYSITVDRNGNLVVTGWTFSPDFPVSNQSKDWYFWGDYSGQGDIFVIKFSNSGERKWVVLYGGSLSDAGRSIASDFDGNVFLTGTTWSEDFPTHNPGGSAYYQDSLGGIRDAFILKLDSTVIREWATYYGGSDKEHGYSITVDVFGNVFLTSSTSSPDLPTLDPGGNAFYQEVLAGHNDIFIFKYSNSGVMEWATFYGGESADFGYSVTTDLEGNVFLTGLTASPDFHTFDPGGGTYYLEGDWGFFVFILKFSNTGERLCATCYGGETGGGTRGLSIKCDDNGNIFVVGVTTAPDLPLFDPGGGAYFQENPAGQPDIYAELFILKFTNHGVPLWATYYGGSESDYVCGSFIDREGNFYVVGYTYSVDFPLFDPGGGAYYQNSLNGSQDGFVLKFNNSGVQEWATFLGGGYSDWAYDIAVDEQGNVFVAGYTYSTDFPTFYHNGAYYQGNNAGYFDIFITKFEPLVGANERQFTPFVICSSFIRDKIVLNFSGSPGKPVRVLLYDPSGKLLLEKNHEFNKTVVIKDDKLSELRKGIYFLMVCCEEKNLGTIKFIKE